MYRIDPNPEFWADVTVKAPGDGEAAGTFRAKFRALTIDEFSAYDLATPDGVAEFLADTVRNIDDVEGQNGQALTFSDAARDQLVSIPHVRSALLRAYMAGFSDAAMGN